MTTQTDIGHDRGWLTPAAAASLARIDATLGHAMQITEAGRDYARQLEHWNTYQRVGYPIALHPDTPSIHQLGNAIDTDEGQQHVELLDEHGWRRTVYRKGKLVEPWHFEYSATRDEHLNDPQPTTTPSSSGDSSMDNFTFYRHSDGRVMTIAGGQSIDLNEADARKLIDIQRLNNKRAPQVYAPAPTFTQASTFFNLDQAGWNLMRAVFPPR